MNTSKQNDPSQSAPFVVGRKYRVTQDYSYLNHEFRQGEVVVFDCQSYDAHAGLMRYWFESPSKKEKNVWHVWDDAPKDNLLWSDYFEEIPE